MYELIIIFSRFLFVFYIAYFLLQGALYILTERGLRETPPWRAVSVQRVTIVFMHLTAFLILAYVPREFAFDTDMLMLGAIGLGFILMGQFLADKVYKGSCPLMWNSVFFLLDTGFIMLARLDPGLAQQQMLWFVTAFGAMLVIPFGLKFVPKFEKLEKIYLIVSLGLLISPLLFGARTFGALRWVRIGESFQFQPSELVKFLFVFYLASVFRKKLTFKQLVFPTAAAVVLVMILVAATDLGSALIFFLTYMMIMYISTGSAALFALGIIGASGGAVIAYHFFSHVQVRVAAWQNPWVNMDSGGFQIVRSLFAIGTWGILGSGLTRGLPGSVPVVESDFIFAAITEEFGSFFGIGLIGVFILLFYRGVHIALRCDRRYYSLLAAGFTSMLAFQTFIIIGGVTKFIPLTGITLPFVSYGGTSIVVSMLMIGILQWVYIYNSKAENGG